MRLAELVSWLDETLDARSFKDYGPNGLQVVGADEVTHLATAVSVSLEVIERAIAGGAQALLVHHGLFWQGDDPVIGELERRRLQTMFAGDLSLLAYHLPLDAHPTLGNNALLADLLGLVERAPFGEHGGVMLGVRGALAAPTAVGAASAPRTPSMTPPCSPNGARSTRPSRSASSALLPSVGWASSGRW